MPELLWLRAPTYGGKKGVFLVADNSSVKMVSAALMNTGVELDEGRAIIEAVDV